MELTLLLMLRTGTIGVTGDAKVTLKINENTPKFYTINYHQ